MDVDCETQVNITPAEIKVLELVRQGMTNREIADKLKRSVFTIKTHVEHILSKTGARNRAHVCSMHSLDEEKLNASENRPNGV